MSITVCRSCEARYPACWGSCEKYIKARAEHDAAMAEHIRRREAEAAAKDVQYHGIERTRRRKRR